MQSLAIEWHHGHHDGVIRVLNGSLAAASVVSGQAAVDAVGAFSGEGPFLLKITVDGENVSLRANPTFISVQDGAQPFCVLLRDITTDFPVWLPTYQVIVTEASDDRSYPVIAEALRAHGTQTVIQRINSEAEESYANAAAATRELFSPTWLGLSRDMRIFELQTNIDPWTYQIAPRFHGNWVRIPETGEARSVIEFFYGRGIGCVRDVTRRLEDGILPILHGTILDDDITYASTAFVSLETAPLTAETLRGTHFLVADRNGCGNMMTPAQEAIYEALLPGEMARDEETVLYFRVRAVNTAAVPRYAWFKAPRMVTTKTTMVDGCVRLESGRVVAVAKLNGAPFPKEEVAILLKPHESAEMIFAFPHQPVSMGRAAALQAQSFTARHAECRAFWQEKLAQAAQLELPEARIEEMARAGLLHLDLVTYGLEPMGTLAACIGIYCPIGSESSPIIQFIDSMGWHDVARRALMYFLDKQHDDGFIQNFGGYMLETGPALWSIGEHYRYTRDDAWAREIAPKLIKACDFLLAWRNRNLREELRGCGYGLMEGKVADPEDPFRSFMLNGYAYLGMIRVAEMLAGILPEESVRLAREAAGLKADLRTALLENMAKSPAVPMGDGSWSTTVGPWAEANGPVCLATDENNWFTHATFTARDSMLYAHYLILAEVLEPREPMADAIMNFITEYMHMRNVAFSQPYYSPHPWMHLKRGEVKPFLKEYYNGFAGLADRQTYTFWEHYSYASPHKTHEEGWFLMRTRWMLYLEDGDTLHLLPGIPRAWMEQGKRLALRDVATYFGPVSLTVESQVEQDSIIAVVDCATDRKPVIVEIRLPHPNGQKAVQVSGGVYNPVAESIRIEGFTGHAEMSVAF